LAASPDLKALREFYGLLPQPPSDPFQFFLWEILSADALPARRDLAWLAFRRIPALTPDSVFRTPAKVLLHTVNTIGPHGEDRVERIRAAVGAFKRNRDALEPEALRTAGLKGAWRLLRKLSELPRDMIDRALLFAAGYLVMPLDDHAARVVARLDGTSIPVSGGAEGFTLKRARWARELRRQRRRARRTLVASLPRELDAYKEAILYLRHHGQQTCIAVGPHCGVCPIAADCRFAQAGPAL
jgi:endonuclease III